MFVKLKKVLIIIIFIGIVIFFFFMLLRLLLGRWLQLGWAALKGVIVGTMMRWTESVLLEATIS